MERFYYYYFKIINKIEAPGERSLIRAVSKIVSEKGFDLKDLIEVRLGTDSDSSAPGKTGTIFLRSQGADLSLSFSLMFPSRSIDLTADSVKLLNMLVNGFKLLLKEQQEKK